MSGQQQQALDAFTDVSSNSSEPKSKPKSQERTLHESVSNIESDVFDWPSNTNYPTSNEDPEKTTTYGFCIDNDDGVVTPTFVKVAGKGTIGKKTQTAETTAPVGKIDSHIGLPVMVSGGGMNTPMGSGSVIGALEDVTVNSDSNSITVRVTEVFQENSISLRDVETRDRKLGAYTLWLPETVDDCKETIYALTKWRQGTIEHIDPQARRTDEIKTTVLERFKQLSPGDRVSTPEYKSELKVVSELFETAVVIPRASFDDRIIDVEAVTVQNTASNGGYYQLGIQADADASGRTKLGPTKHDEDIPTCYLSHSASSPPTPNTAFTRDCRFSGAELEVTEIPHPPNPMIVSPDTSVQESPLPEPRLRSSINSIDGVGETTQRKLIQELDTGRISAESIAWTLFGDTAGPHQNNEEYIMSVLEKLPNSDTIFTQLRSFTPGSET